MFLTFEFQTFATLGSEGQFEVQPLSRRLDSGRIALGVAATNALLDRFLFQFGELCVDSVNPIWNTRDGPGGRQPKI